MEIIEQSSWLKVLDTLFEYRERILTDEYTAKGGSNCLQKPYNIHRNQLKTLAFYY